MKKHIAGEDYLKTIYILQKQIDRVRSIDVANYLGFSRPSVSNAVSVLQDAGLLQMNNDFSLSLTEKGEKIAVEVYERNCFFKKLLMSSGVDEETAVKEACNIEHAISEDSFLKLKKKVDSLPFIDI